MRAGGSFGPHARENYHLAEVLRVMMSTWLTASRDTQPEEVPFLVPDEEPEDEQPERIPSKFERLISSRKFWAALVALLLVVLKGYQPDFPLDEAQVTNLVYVLVAYIMGVALGRWLNSEVSQWESMKAGYL